MIALLLTSFSFVLAQGNGSGHNGAQHGNGGSGSGSGLHGSNQNNSPWAGMNIPNSWKHWLDNGGNMPGDLRDAILFKASTSGFQAFALPLNLLRQRYNQGTLIITYVATAPPSLSFRVSFGGTDIILIIDNA